MISSKALQLVETLYNKTMADTLSWSQTVDDGVYQLAYPNFTIKIFDREGYSGGTDIVLQIFNDNAVLVDEITDVDLSSFAGYEPPEAFKYMKTLLNKARAQALGVEKVINDILNQLGACEDSDTGEDIPF